MTGQRTGGTLEAGTVMVYSRRKTKNRKRVDSSELNATMLAKTMNRNEQSSQRSLPPGTMNPCSKCHPMFEIF